jgi:hypothetical protein
MKVGEGRSGKGRGGGERGEEEEVKKYRRNVDMGGGYIITPAPHHIVLFHCEGLCKGCGGGDTVVSKE